MAAIPVPPPPPPLPEVSEDDRATSASPTNASNPNLQSANNYQEAHKPGNSWERPIKIEELRQKTRNWSLAGDAGLLLYLQDFSQKMFTKTHELEKLVDGVIHETKGMDSKLHNTFNDFLMISNKQFIENRVYDEEIAQEESSEKETNQQKEKTKEQLESEILPRFSAAVNLGLQVLDDAFITVEIRPTEESDDEDEESSLPAGYVPDPVIEVKDIYGYRPLPHLIGTAEFFQDETVGLKVESDEEEDQTTKKEESGSETSESDSESESGSEYSESSEDEDVETKKQHKKLAEDSEYSDSDDGDLFGEPKKKSDDESSEYETEKPPLGKVDLQAELTSKLGLQNSTPPAIIFTDDSAADTQSIASTTTYDAQSIASHSTYDTQSIASVADTISVVPTPSHSKGRSKSRSKSRTKSIDSRRKHKGSTSSHKKHEKQGRQEPDEDLFGPSKQEDTFDDDSPFGKKGGLFSGGGGGGGGLFDDGEGEDLFGDSKRQDEIEKEDTVSVLSQPETVTEIKPRIKRTSSGKKIPAGAVSIFGDASPLFGATTPTKETPAKAEDLKVASPVAGSPPKEKKPLPPVKGLFDDDEEDDAFNTKKNQLTEPTAPLTRRKKTLELFDDEDDLFDDKTGKPAQNKVTSPISQESKKITVNANSQPAKVGGLFDENDSSLFTDKPSSSKETTSKPPESSSSAVISLFGEDDAGESDDLFAGLASSKPKKQTSSENGKQPGKPDVISKQPESKPFKAQSLAKQMKAPSLFDEDDEEDLFGTPAISKPKSIMAKPPEKNEPKIESTATHKVKSVFRNENSGMFGDEQADLFSGQSKVKQNEQITKPKKAAKTSRSPGLFVKDDEEDDPLGIRPSPSKDVVINKDDPSVIPSRSENEGKSAMAEIPEASSIKIAASADLFVDSDEEEEGLFSQSSKITGSTSKIQFDGGMDGPKSNYEAKVARPKDLKLDTTGENDGLFASNSETPEHNVDDGEEGLGGEKIRTQSGRKQLAGAVSLFGGIDPFAAKTKLRKTPEKERPNDLLTSSDKTDDGLFGSRQKISPVVAPKLHPKVGVSLPPSLSSTPISSAIAKHTLTFNPAALLPGAVPPRKEPEKIMASFDEPAAVKTLENATKERSRGAKRRPPSRNALRQSSTPDSVEKSQYVGVESVMPTHSTESRLIITESDRLRNVTTQPRQVVNRLEDSLVHNKQHNKIEKVKERNTSENKLQPNDIFHKDEDDIFVSKLSKPENVSGISKEKHLVDESKTVLKQPKVKQTDHMTFDDDENDLFTSKSRKSEKISSIPKEDLVDHSKTATKEIKITQDNVVTTKEIRQDNVVTNNDDEGIFGNKQESSVENSKGKAVSADMFGNDLAVAKPKKSKVEKKKEFDDVNNDLLGTSQQNGEVYNVNNGQEHLFPPSVATGDEKISEKDSKQEEIPNSKDTKPVLNDTKPVLNAIENANQEEGKKESTRKKKEVASIFTNIDDDNLFVSDSIKKEEITEAKISKPNKSKPRVTDDDIFGDTGSIFDNIPTKTKEKKKKRTEASDIFASSKSSEKKAKPKKKAEKTAKAKSSKITTSIFDDNSPNIFDDPLNALGGD